MKKVLVFGGNGLVGSRFVELFNNKLEINAPLAVEVDILDKDQIIDVFRKFNPDCIINFAAYTNVGEAEIQKDNEGGLCYRINVLGAKNVADACRQYNKYLIHISTDYVFDGQKAEPYTEADIPNPINWYGMTKYLGEKEVLKSECLLAIVRISMPYRAKYKLKRDIGRFFLEQLQKGNKIMAVDDQTVTPTFVDDIANALYKILENRTKGIIHVSCKTPTTPYEFAKTIARIFKLDETLISPVSISVYNLNKKAKMLQNSALDSSKFDILLKGILHNLDEAVNLFKDQLLTG